MKFRTVILMLSLVLNAILMVIDWATPSGMFNAFFAGACFAVLLMIARDR